MTTGTNDPKARPAAGAERDPNAIDPHALDPNVQAGGTPVSAAGHTPPDQDSEPPLSADDGSTDDDPATPSPSERPASPGALH